MKRKWLFSLIMAVGLIFVFFFSLNTFAFAQQEKKTEDIADISLDELLNVEITTAGKKAEKISDIPASVVLITREDIQKYGYETLEEILENVPGMYAINDYFWMGGKGYGVRGFYATGAFKDMIIMINGVSQIENDYDSYPTGYIPVPVEAIDRIEIVRGPMSVIYGSGAFFGSINIITNQDTDKPVNMIAVGGGSLKTSKYFGRYVNNSGDFKFSFNAGLYRTNGIDVPFSDMTSDINSLSESTGIAVDEKTGGMLTDHRKFVNFTGSYKNFYIDFSHSFVEMGMIDGLPGVGPGHLASISNSNVTFGYKKKFSEKFDFNSIVHYHNSENYSDYSYIAANNYGMDRIKGDAFEFLIDFFFTPSSTFDLTAGINFKEVVNNEAQYDVPEFGAFNFDIKMPRDEDQKKGSIYTQINFRPVKKLKFTAGARLEKIWPYDMFVNIGPDLANLFTLTYHYENNKVNFVPRVAAIYSINERNIFKIMYGEAIKNPSFGENFDIMLYQGALPDLVPAKIRTLEFNYFGSFSSRINFNVSFFMNKLDKLITRANYLTEEGPVWVTTNSGKMDTTGVEAGFQLMPIENLKFDVSGIYQKSKDKRDGFENIDLGYSPKLLGYFKLDYKVKNFSIAFLGRYIDKMQTRYDDIQEIRIGEETKAYFILDGNLHLENLINKGIFFNIKVHNILDEEIRYPTTDSNIWADKGYLGSGIGFLFTAGYKF